MSELLTMWAQWLPELWKGFVLSMQVTAVSLGLGVVLGLLLAWAFRRRTAGCVTPPW